MTDAPPPPQPARRRSRRWILALAEAGALAITAAIAIGVGLHGRRHDLAADLAEDWLAQQGVPATIAVEEITGDTLIGRMTLGPRRAPDITVGRLEMAYEIVRSPAGKAELQVRALRLSDVVLRTRLTQGRLSFGSLDPLVEEFLKAPRPPSGGPAVVIDRAQVLVATPLGPMRLNGSAALDDGLLARLDVRLAPTRLADREVTLDLAAARLTAQQANGRVKGGLRLTANELAEPGAALIDAALVASFDLPYPQGPRLALAGPASLDGRLTAGGLGLGDAAGQGVELIARFDGGLGGEAPEPRFSGRGVGRLRADALSAPNAVGRNVSLDFNLPRLMAARLGQGLRLTAGGPTRLAAGRLELTGPQGGLFLAALDAPLTSEVHVEADRFRLDASGAVRARGGASAAAAQRIAAQTPVAADEPAYRQALAGALRDFSIAAPQLQFAFEPGATRLRLGQPLTIEAAGGVRASLAGVGRAPVYAEDAASAFAVQLAGGGLPDVKLTGSDWRWRPGGFEGQVGLDATLDFAMARGLTLAASGRAAMTPRGFAFTARGCQPLKLARLELGEKDITGVSAELCPGGAPLFATDAGGWRLTGGFKDLAGHIEAAEAGATRGAGQIRLGGGARGVSGEVTVAEGRLVDATAEPRFRPLAVGGRVTARDDVWDGDLALGSIRHPQVARIRLRHDVRAERGFADIATPGLTFAPDELQPAELTPMADVVERAAGRAEFTGRIDWRGATLTSSGRLTTQGLAFHSPAGQVIGARAEIAFTSLAPLISAPDQPFSAERVEAFTPVTNIEGRLALEETSARLGPIGAEVAKGRVRLEPMLWPFAGGPVEGTLQADDVDLGQVIAGLNIADKIKADAVIDATLPFTLAETGISFREGRLEAVKPGRLSIAREALGDVSTGTEGAQVNFVQELAYQAMGSLAFDSLAAVVASREGGRLGIVFHVVGKHDPEVGEEAYVMLKEVIDGTVWQRRVPLPKGTPVDLTLDTSLNFDELLAAYAETWRREPKP